MDQLEICVTREELGSICSALNEVLGCLDEQEIHIRMGRSEEEIKLLLKKMESLLSP